VDIDQCLESPEQQRDKKEQSRNSSLAHVTLAKFDPGLRAEVSRVKKSFEQRLLLNNSRIALIAVTLGFDACEGN